MKKLAMLMPKYSLAELMAHDEWYQTHKIILVGGAHCSLVGITLPPQYHALKLLST